MCYAKLARVRADQIGQLKAAVDGYHENLTSLAKLNAEQEVLIEHLDREADHMASIISQWVPARNERGHFQKRSH